MNKEITAEDLLKQNKQLFVQTIHKIKKCYGPRAEMPGVLAVRQQDGKVVEVALPTANMCTPPPKTRVPYFAVKYGKRGKIETVFPRKFSTYEEALFAAPPSYDVQQAIDANYAKRGEFYLCPHQPGGEACIVCYANFLSCSADA